MTQLIELENDAGLQLKLMTTGAALLSLNVPVGDGYRNVLLGCQPEQYASQQVYLNAMVGRFANRIGGSVLHYQGQTHHLVPSQGENCLHGGTEGFDRKEWHIVSQQADKVVLSLHSPDGDQGFPGEFDTTLTYSLQGTDLLIEIEAQVSKPCPVNMTCHGYFNLDGKRSDVRDHSLMVNANDYLPIDGMGIPLSAPQPVEAALDLRHLRCLREQWLSHPQLVSAKGFDHCYVLATDGPEQVAAHLVSADKKLAMDVLTDQPGLQIYTGNYLAGAPAGNEDPYHDYEGICLETQLFPDSPNRPELGDPWLLPGQTYRHLTRYRFIAQ
jgi:aldose 1-epimerase